MQLIEATWDSDNPLERIKGESVKANQAFRDYVLMDKRSIKSLLESYQNVPDAPTLREPTLKDWSRNFHWQARLADYQRIKFEEREQLRDQRREQLEDNDWNTGEDLRKVAKGLLGLLGLKLQNVARAGGDFNDVPATFGQINQALKVASELQRLSVDEPTANINLSGAALDSAIAKEIERLHNSTEARHISQAALNEDD